MAFQEVISIGTFASFQALFLSLSDSFMYLTQYAPMMIGARGAWFASGNFRDRGNKVADSPRAIDLAPLARAIEFNNVSFSYAPERTTLDRLDLAIKRDSSHDRCASSF